MFIIGAGSVRAPAPPIQRYSGTPCALAAARRDRERHAEDRIRAQLPLVRGAVERVERAVDARLVVGVATEHFASEDVVHVLHGLQHALAEIPLGVAIAQLDRFVRARRRARGHRGPSGGAAVEEHLDLHGRVAA